MKKNLRQSGKGWEASKIHARENRGLYVWANGHVIGAILQLLERFMVPYRSVSIFCRLVFFFFFFFNLISIILRPVLIFNNI